MKACNRNIERTLELAEALLDLADQGDADREDVSCGVMYGIMRDAGYRLKQLAERERESHKEKGRWPD